MKWKNLDARDSQTNYTPCFFSQVGLLSFSRFSSICKGLPVQAQQFFVANQHNLQKYLSEPH